MLALLPPPLARNYRIMAGVCTVASALTLTSNVLYMLRGWKEPLPFYDWSSDGIRWMTSQIWYAIGMIFLFHVVTRPAQSGVVLFGKFPRDLWAYKWYLCILYIPVHFMLLELCDIHRENEHILIPLEIIVDLSLYNGPFLIVLLRILYLAWKVAYDEAVLTGAIFEDDGMGLQSPVDGTFPGGRNHRGASSGRNGYVGLAMVDHDEAESGSGHRGTDGLNKKANGIVSASDQVQQENTNESVYILEDGMDEEEDNDSNDLQARSSSRKGLLRSSPRSSPNRATKSVAFQLDHNESEEEEEEGEGEEQSPKTETDGLVENSTNRSSSSNSSNSSSNSSSPVAKMNDSLV
ncbi:hypothetical protein BG004_007113 [Podila humilis]|nr:hypothetical protein BG004_007113 [Podila humilis]